MALKTSSLSFACESIRQFIQDSLFDSPTDITVQIGSPGQVDEENTQNIVNLFFYRFEPSGFGPLSISNQAWRLRVNCLVTVFGGVLDSVSAGDNELRMLGEVIRVFHETPILDLQVFTPIEDGVPVGPPVSYRLNAVFQPLNEDQLSQFWTANSTAAIRPSIAYDFSLVSIAPEQIHVEAPLVGAIGAEARSGIGHRYSAPSVAAESPTLNFTIVDTDNPAWEPRICWIVSGQCQLSITMSRLGAATFTPDVWIAGDPNETVEFVWQTWDPLTGWENVAGALPPVNPFSRSIDPDNVPASIPGTFPVQVPLPSLGAAGARQVMLHVRRTFSIVSGGTPQTVLSNPILISLFETP